MPRPSSPHVGLLDLPGELYGEICRHLRPCPVFTPGTGGEREQQQQPRREKEDVDEEEDDEEEVEEEDEEEDEDKEKKGRGCPASSSSSSSSSPPFCARSHRDVTSFASCCRAVRAARPDLATAKRRRLTVPLSRLSPSPFVVHADSARSPFFFAFYRRHRHQQRHHHAPVTMPAYIDTPPLPRELVVLLDLPSSWVGRMLQLLLQLEHSGAGVDLRRLDIVIVTKEEEGEKEDAAAATRTTMMMKTTEDMLRRMGAQLRRSAPGLEELRIDERLNLTHAFYDGLFPSKQQQQQGPTWIVPGPPSPRVLDIGLGDRFPSALTNARQETFARLERLALMHGLRQGHGLGVSVLLAHAPALTELRLGGLIPGVNWESCWPPGLRRISIRRVYDCDIGALEALAHCGPSLRRLEFDVFFVHRPTLAWTLARVARRLRDAREARVRAEILAYDGAFYDNDDEDYDNEAEDYDDNAEASDNAEDLHMEEDTEEETGGAATVADHPLNFPPNAPESLSVARLLNDGLIDTLQMLRSGLVKGDTIQLDRVTVDAASVERLASCVPDTVGLNLHACSLMMRGRPPCHHRCRREEEKEKEKEDPLCVAVRRFPRLRSLSFHPVRRPTRAQLIDIGARVVAAAFRARAPTGTHATAASSSSSSSSASSFFSSSPPLDIWIWSGRDDMRKNNDSDDDRRGIRDAWATKLEAQGLPIRIRAKACPPASPGAAHDTRRGIVRPHLLQRSLEFYPSPHMDADVIIPG